MAGAAAAALLLGGAVAGVAGAELGAEPSDAEKRALDENWRLSVTKQKGPYTQNYCVCSDGKKRPVQLPDGRIVSPCGGAPKFCAAFREPWAQALADQRMYIANLFARDLWQWDSFPDHHDLVRGFILEKFYIETHPDHKLAEMRSYGGLAGAEYEARDAPRFFERYLSMPEFDEPRHYLLAYELQRRFFVRDDQGQISRVRNLASAIQRKKADFKPLRDAVHNQISAALVPKLAEYRDRVGPGEVADSVEELRRELLKLTAVDESALRAQALEIEDDSTRTALNELVAAAGRDDVVAITRLADLMMLARQTVERAELSSGDRRRLIDLSITAAAVIQQRASHLLDGDARLTARLHLELLAALANAAYGSGLLVERERLAVSDRVDTLLTNPSPSRGQVKRALAGAARVVEWAQRGTLYAFEESRPAWNYLLPETVLLADDVLRGSPLLVYARVLERLQDWSSASDPIRHEIFGAELDAGVRALNPGLAVGTLRVAPSAGGYARDEIVALPETPADLEPAAGILTRGEGNVVSHVQLLARALGIPNAVLAAAVYQRFAEHDGREAFFIATPGGRVIVKDAADMTPRDQTIVAEYRGREERTTDGELQGGGNKLHIDKDRIDLSVTHAIDLASVRRVDSGVRGGPKAAYLGELKHWFPDRVARGIVVPFGAYYAHYLRARVRVPEALAGAGLAEPGEPLSDFVERTYATFFDSMLASGTPEAELSAWIRPRLEVMRASIEGEPLSDALRSSIADGLAQEELLDAARRETVGVFVRSDTNVEDLDNFNGAGLNLTLFNLRTLEDVFTGLKRVWASPFTYRSFSWRQALIDEPLWVLPSVVILESVATEKSGVLVTSDVDGSGSGEGEDAMLIATSEGVGGAVDGSPAETLVWSPAGVELVTVFKSPWRRMLQPEGGSAIVPSTRGQYVLLDDEVAELVATAQAIRERLEPVLNHEGRPRPWDIEYGFAGGKLWLFQVRPFLGNDSLQNVPALAAYEAKQRSSAPPLSLDDVIAPH